jgi:triosephosphate isomerase
MDKKTLVVGNWKMHLNVQQASLLVRRLAEHVRPHANVEVVLAPSMLALQPVSLEVDRRRFRLAAQDAYAVDEGAYTGEVSFAMLQDLVHYAIIGHSARRLYFGETNKQVREKVQAAVRNDIRPIVCIGETKKERDAGETKAVLYDQLITAVANLTSSELERVVIAYEPTWAISTFDGIVPKPQQIAEVVEYIRLQISELYGKRTAERLRVLYGGSVDSQTVRGYLELDGVDGVLVGAASLNYQQFASICQVAHQVNTEGKKHAGR